MGIGAAILGAAGIGAVGAAVAGHEASSAADKASDTQLQMYQQTRSDLLPFQSTGASALSQLATLFGLGPGGTGTPNAQAATSSLAQFPGYQFGLDQGVQALDRSAASRGLLLSGATLQDTQKFGQQYAMQQAWQPYVSTLTGLSTLGENAAAGTGAAGTAAANGAANATLQGGSAAGNATAGIANTLSSSLASYALNNNPTGSSGFVPAGSSPAATFGAPTVSALAGPW